VRHATCPLAPAEEIARGWLTAHALTSMRCRPETCDARAREGFLCLTGHRKRTTRGHTVARIRIKEPKRIRLLQGGCCTSKSACEEPNHMFRSEGVRCGDIKSEERSSRRLAAWVVHVPRSVTSVQFTHHRSRKHTAHAGCRFQRSADESGKRESAHVVPVGADAHAGDTQEDSQERSAPHRRWCPTRRALAALRSSQCSFACAPQLCSRGGHVAAEAQRPN
jgi:hypothetical protein